MVAVAMVTGRARLCYRGRMPFTPDDATPITPASELARRLAASRTGPVEPGAALAAQLAARRRGGDTGICDADCSAPGGSSRVLGSTPLPPPTVDPKTLPGAPQAQQTASGDLAPAGPQAAPTGSTGGQAPAVEGSGSLAAEGPQGPAVEASEGTGQPWRAAGLEIGRSNQYQDDTTPK
jgi:hypothetical protein